MDDFVWRCIEAMDCYAEVDMVWMSVQ
jgi:hypothetical protein